MAKREDWIKRKTLGNDCVEICYIETDNTGVYVIKETMDRNRTTKEKKRDVVLNFPIELLEKKRIGEFDSPYPKYEYRINIDGKEYVDSVKQIRSLIQKKVVKQPFYSKYGFKFRDYIRIALYSQEKKLEKRGNER